MSQDAKPLPPTRPPRFRIVTPAQFKKGYTMRYGRFEWQVAYREIERMDDGNIVVLAPAHDFGFGE